MNDNRPNPRARLHLAALLSLGMLAGCSDRTPDPLSDIPRLNMLWELRQPTSDGHLFLSGDLLLGTGTVKAVNLASRTLAFNVPAIVNFQRSSYVGINDLIVAVTGVEGDTLTILDRRGTVLNTLSLPGGSRDSIHQTGPYVVGNSLFVVSGNRVFKFRTADLLSPSATPVWIKSYPGLRLASLLVENEDRVYVATHDDTTRDLVALDGNGMERWRVPFSSDPKSLSTAFAMEIYNDTIIAQISYLGLQAFKTSTGAAVWARPQSINLCPGGEAVSSFNMTIAAGKVFMGPFGGSCVLAFDAITGEKAWVFDTPNRLTTDTKPVYINGVVYAANTRLWAIDAQTGTALAVGGEDLGSGYVEPVVYDPVRNQLVTWTVSGVRAYQPLK